MLIFHDTNCICPFYFAGIETFRIEETNGNAMYFNAGAPRSSRSTVDLQCISNDSIVMSDQISA